MRDEDSLAGSSRRSSPSTAAADLEPELLRQGTFRFKPGDRVFIRDAGVRGGYRIVEAVVQDVHYHGGREPFYPHGEGYAFNYRGVGPEPEDGPNLWWDCYPGCRVWATREEALAARMTEDFVRGYFYGR